MNLANSARHYIDHLVINLKDGTKIYRQNWLIKLVAAIDEGGMMDDLIAALKEYAK